MCFSTVAAAPSEQNSAIDRFKLHQVILKRSRKAILNKQPVQVARSLQRRRSRPLKAKASGFNRIIEIKQMKVTPKPFRLFDLPGGLRNEVYAHLLTAPNGLAGASEAAFEGSNSPDMSSALAPFNVKEVARIYSNLSLTCKQMHGEVRHLPTKLNQIHFFPVFREEQNENGDLDRTIEVASEIRYHSVYKGLSRAKGLAFYFSIPDFFYWKVNHDQRIKVDCFTALKDTLSDMFEMCNKRPSRKHEIVLTYRDLAPLPACRMNIVVVCAVLEQFTRSFPKNFSIAFHVCWQAGLTESEELSINVEQPNMEEPQVSIKKEHLKQSMEEYGVVIEMSEAEFEKRYGFHALTRDFPRLEMVLDRLVAGGAQPYNLEYV